MELTDTLVAQTSTPPIIQGVAQRLRGLAKVLAQRAASTAALFVFHLLPVVLSGSDRRHLPTRLGALVARARASLAVPMRVPAAFVPAGLTGLRAHQAQVACVIALPCQQGGRQAAQVGAVHVEGNATRHGLHVVFAQASGGAAVAGICACMTGLNAGFVAVRRRGGHGAPFADGLNGCSWATRLSKPRSPS